MNSSQKYFLKLLSSEVNNTEIKPPSESVNLKAVFAFARKHKTVAAIYEKALGIGIISENDIEFNAYKNDYVLSKTRDVRQLIAKDEVASIFAENGIRVMLLKGLIIKDLYPQTYYRQMTDLDILIDNENREKARTLLKSIGYEDLEITKGEKRHFSMLKKPAVNIEIHLSLFENEWNTAFADVWENSKQIDKNLYVMSNEDLILHNIMHSAEHFLSGGIGVRAVLDFYILKKAYPDVILSESFISRLKEYELFDFYNVINDISDVWFGGLPEKQHNETAEKFLLSSNTFGTDKDAASQYAANLVGEHNNRFIIILKLLFPSYKDMCLRFTILKRVKILLPFCWLIRIVRMPFYVSDSMVVVKELAKIDSEKIAMRNEITKSFGLSDKNK